MANIAITNIKYNNNKKMLALQIQFKFSHLRFFASSFHPFFIDVRPSPRHSGQFSSSGSQPPPATLIIYINAYKPVHL
jgi:hypothetical protein